MASLVFLALAALAPVVARRGRKAPHRALMEVPEKPIAAVTDGERVRIKGRAVARGALRTAPISQRQCIGYRLTVESHDGALGVWQPVLEDDTLDAFLLADGTGEAVLHGPFDIRLDPIDKSGGERPPPALFELLERENVPIFSLLGGERHFQYVETVVLPGEEITAVGRATIEVDPASRAASHRAPPVTCHLRGADGPVILADAEEP